MPEGIIHAHGLDIQIQRHPRRKHLCLEFVHNGLIAKAPRCMSEKTILNFIISQKNWVKKNKHHLESRSAIVLLNKEKLYFQGHELQITFINAKKTSTDIANKIFYLPKHQSNNTQSLKKTLITYYRQSAQQYAVQQSKKYAHAMKLDFDTTHNVKVRQYKRRWGSCNKKQISLNWRLIMAPSFVFDYVIIHELAHLIEFNHSARFWNIVAQYMKDWSEAHQWLQNKGDQLYCL